MDDAAFIVWIRNQEQVKGKIGDSATDIAGQQAWLAAYFERPDDYYFIIETTRGVPVGTYGLYNINGDQAETGRWIVRPDVPAAIPSCVLAYNFAFSKLGLKFLLARTVSTNQSVLSLNWKLGFRQTWVDKAAMNIDGRPVDLINFTLNAEEWPKTRASLLPMARVAQRQIEEWEASLPQTVSNEETNTYAPA
jgi:RimJ/RimL family protein N-acetyltransferase